MLECVQWSTSLVYQYLFANFSTINMLHIYEFYSQLFDGGVGGEGGGGFPAGPIIGNCQIINIEVPPARERDIYIYLLGNKRYGVFCR